MPHSWKDKILSHATPPPLGAWDNIAKKLDEDDNNTTVGLAEKMASHEAIPPLAAWDNIVAELDKDEQVKSIPLINRTKKRYIYWSTAAAAAILLIITFATWNKEKPSKEELVADPGMPIQKQVPVQYNDQNKQLAKKDTFIKQKNTVPSQNRNIEKQQLVNNNNIAIPQINYVKANEPVILTGDPLEINNEKIINNNGEYAVNTDIINAPNSYVMVTGPDGSSKRISSKLSAYIGYLDEKDRSNEEAIDIIIREGPLWRGRLKDWSNKMINTPIAPTIFNFMNMVELSNLLSEKK